MIPVEYHLFFRICLFAIINGALYFSMAYMGHAKSDGSFISYLISEDFNIGDAAQFIGLLVALSVFTFMALGKFATSWNIWVKTAISAFFIPTLIILLYYFYM